MKTNMRMNRVSHMVLASLLMAGSTAVQAQEADSDSSNLLFEEILVTATKKSAAQAVQDVPLAATAYGERQLDALHFRDIESLSFKMPNVALDDIGSAKSVANFSIRGLGVNSSIPSIDPTVGMFIDGVYIGTITGSIANQFDLEGIEVLRGPQGLLFGRNVTGGAIVLKTSKPSFETRVRAKASYESGNNYTLEGVYSGPIIEDKLAIKLAVHYNDDNGYFENTTTGNDSFGKNETKIFRPAVTFRPTDSTDITVQYEYGRADGDGPAAQNRGIYDRNTFDLGFDEEGFNDQNWDMLTSEINQGVSFGDGTITNIFAWRDMSLITLGDIDSSPAYLYTGSSETHAEQYSNELRYAGTFGDFDLTTGLYYFTQDLLYIERRELLFGTIDIIGGGTQETTTKAAFASLDYNVNEKLTLNFGLRYTEEEKDVEIATVRPAGCSFETDSCVPNFFSDEKWSNWTPKIGFQYRVNDDSQIYGFYTQGHRSGGYNLRNTSPTASPGPFDPETQHSFELGVKADNADKTIRVNAAVFYNLIDDMQREVNVPHPTAGIVQIIDNTADGRIMGAEVELTAQLHENLTFIGSLGLLDDKYRSVIFDISGDGVVDSADEDLQLPRLAPVTFGAGLIYNAPIEDWGSVSASVNFNHRDQAYYNDSNTAILDAVDMLDASVSLGVMDDSVTFTVYGKNLLNEVQAGGESLLPFGPGHTFSPLKKGRVYGAEVKYRF